MPTSFKIFKHLSNYEYAMLGYKTNSELKNILFMTLPKQSLVLTSTNRTEIDKVLRELVGKVGMIENINEALLDDEFDYILWHCYNSQIDMCNAEYLRQREYVSCSTADEFLAHFEKPKFIDVPLRGRYNAKVKQECIQLWDILSNNLIYTLTTEELNQIVNAQKELQ